MLAGGEGSTLPLRSKDTNNRGFYYSINGICALEPYYLGFWTLRALGYTLIPKPKTLNPKPGGSGSGTNRRAGGH